MLETGRARPPAFAGEWSEARNSVGKPPFAAEGDDRKTRKHMFCKHERLEFHHPNQFHSEEIDRARKCLNDQT
ncbi:hypothetical protein ACC771_26785, partial [Rhizobium ruizarguesonis]